MKIRVKVVCTFLTLSKKPPLFQILTTRLCYQVALIEAHPSYAHIRHPDGRESTVFLTDLSPRFQTIDKNTNVDTNVFNDNDSFVSDRSEKSNDTS